MKIAGQRLYRKGNHMRQKTHDNTHQSCWHLQMASERDKSLRSAVLEFLGILYKLEGEAAVWAQVGSLSDQQRSLIEERFKSVSKQMARAQTMNRLASNGNAADHSGPPSPVASRFPRYSYIQGFIVLHDASHLNMKALELACRLFCIHILISKLFSTLQTQTYTLQHLDA